MWGWILPKHDPAKLTILHTSNKFYKIWNWISLVGAAKSFFIFDRKNFWCIFDFLKNHQKLNNENLVVQIGCSHALGIWICGCSLYYKRELWASKSAGAHSTKSLKISGCKRSQRSAGWRNLASDEALGNRCFTDSNLQYIADSFCGLKCSSHTCKRPLYVGHCRGWLNFWIFLPFEPHWDSNRSITSHEQMNFWEDCCIHWLEPWKIKKIKINIR